MLAHHGLLGHVPAVCTVLSNEGLHPDSHPGGMSKARLGPETTFFFFFFLFSHAKGPTRAQRTRHGICPIKYSPFSRRSLKYLQNISIGSMFLTTQQIYFLHLWGENTIGLRSATFYHHCVCAKVRNHLHCPMRTLFYRDFGGQ